MLSGARAYSKASGSAHVPLHEVSWREEGMLAIESRRADVRDWHGIRWRAISAGIIYETACRKDWQYDRKTDRALGFPH